MIRESPTPLGASIVNFDAGSEFQFCMQGEVVVGVFWEGAIWSDLLLLYVCKYMSHCTTEQKKKKKATVGGCVVVSW